MTAKAIALPCPFCGGREITVEPGSTFRWRVAECGNCGARCGETRVQTMGKGNPVQWEIQVEADAIAAWNKRFAP